MGGMRCNPRSVFLAGLGAAAVATAFALPPIPQWKGYHDFADARGFGGIPNALNVLSNLPFLIVGALGLKFLAGPIRGRGPLSVLMIAFLLVAFGSGLYHWAPDDRTLFWDRLPLSLIFTSMLGITLIERVSPRWGALLFLPLLAAGAGSVVHWSVTGDLRFYFVIQAAAILALPLIVLLFPPRYTGGRDLLLVVGLYGLAKLFEGLDGPVFRAGHLVSGHTLKHLLGGAAAWVYLRMLQRRRAMVPPATMPPLSVAE